MDTTARDRTLFPFAVPLGLFAVIIAIVFLFSRILLNVPKPVAIAVALMTALNILITCAVVSTRRLQGFSAFLLVVVLVIPVVLGAAAANKTIKVQVAAQPTPAAAPVVVTANNTAFSTKTINLTPDASGNAQIQFKNNDSVAHNIAIFNGADANAPVLFKGAVIQGGQSITYNVTGLKPGTFFFHCDIHPTLMTGTVVVSAPAGGGGYSASSPAAASTALTISANNLAFDTKTLTAPANTAFTVAFDNKDTTYHNWVIDSGPAGYTPPTPPPPVAPGASTTYQEAALPAGTYGFHCSLHPTLMTGTLTVK